MNTAAKNHFIVSIFFLVVLLIMICSCGSPAYGQVKKDTIPPKRQFLFVEEPPTYNYIDSVLSLALRVVGYELKAPEADGLRNGISSIIIFRRQTARYQDSIYNANLKPIKK